MDLMKEPAALQLLVVAAVLLYAFYRVYKFSAAIHYKSNGTLKVPKGRFWQLSFIGETFEFLWSDSHEFVKHHTKQYGETFRTVLFGEPVIMTSSVEAAEFALGGSQSLENFDTCYSFSFWGKDCMSLLSGTHRRAQLRKLFFQGPWAHENFRKFCPTVSHIARKVLRSPTWNKSAPLIARDELIEYMYQVCLKFMLGIDDKDPKLDIVREWYTEMEDAEFVPRYWNLPGTQFQKGLKARKQLCKFLDEIITERRMNTKEKEQKDLLDVLMEAEISDDIHSMRSTRKLRLPEIRDNTLLALFSGHKTPAFVLTWVLKLLAEHPHVLEEVQEEQDEIAEQLKLEGRTLLTYEDTKKMHCTWRAVQETMRLHAPVAMVPRRATKDLEFQGKLIPKGWRVLVYLQSFMMDPKFHPDPETFNPSRFKTPMQPHTFQPYGGSGPRSCPGMEFSRLEILVFLHYLVTTRSWTLVEEREGIRQWPISVPAKGCPIIVNSRSEKNQ